jgi:acid phosphatase class B
MRFKFRISKYNPAKRNQMGHYMAEDWISISDISSSFTGQTLAHAEYERIEDAYLISIAAFLSESRIDTLTIEKLEMHLEQYQFKIRQ